MHRDSCVSLHLWSQWALPDWTTIWQCSHRELLVDDSASLCNCQPWNHYVTKLLAMVAALRHGLCMWPPVLPLWPWCSLHRESVLHGPARSGPSCSTSRPVCSSRHAARPRQLWVRPGPWGIRLGLHCICVASFAPACVQSRLCTTASAFDSAFDGLKSLSRDVYE